MNGEEFLIDGQTLEDACRVAELAEEAGVDALHVSAYADPSRAIGYSEAHATHIPGRFVPLGAAIKKRVGVPIITVGRIEPDHAEQILADGLADFVLPDVQGLGDLSGFPNGRQLDDDVIDTVLSLIFGVFGPAVPVLQSDNVDGNDVPFLGTFPYLGSPHTS